MRSRLIPVLISLVALASMPVSGSAKPGPGNTAANVPQPKTLAPPPNDDCSGAILLGCGNILISGNTDQAVNDYAFVDTAGSCTGFASNGRDVVYKFNVGPGDSLWIDYRSRTDGSVYLVTDCADIENTCVAGADKSTLANEVEELRYGFATGGVYYLILDSYGLNTSGLWEAVGQLICGPSTPPQNDLCEAQTPITCGGFNLAGSTEFASNHYAFSSQVISCTGQLADGPEVAYRFSATAGDSLWVDYTSTANGSVYIVADCGDVDTTCIAGEDQTGVGQVESLRFKFSFSGVYYLVLDSRDPGVWGTWSAAGELLCLNPPPVNDQCSSAFQVGCGPFSWSGTTTYAINDYALPLATSCTGFGADGKDIVYQIQADAGDSIRVNYRSLTQDGCVYLVTNCADAGNSCVAGIDETFTAEWETMGYVFPSSGTYYLILDSVDQNSASQWTANGTYYCNTVGVGPIGSSGGLALSGISPNPFHGKTNLFYRTAERSRTTLRIYDLQGRIQRTLVDGEVAAGEHQVIWDGADQGGRRLGAGVYFARLSDGRRQAVRRMIFID